MCGVSLTIRGQRPRAAADRLQKRRIQRRGRAIPRAVPGKGGRPERDGAMRPRCPRPSDPGQYYAWHRPGRELGRNNFSLRALSIFLRIVSNVGFLLDRKGYSGKWG